IFDYCEYGRDDRLTDVLSALGTVHQELAVGDLPPGKRRVKYPLGLPSRQWVEASDDGSREFRLARSLAFLRGEQEETARIRGNLAPVSWNGQRRRWEWPECVKAVVWARADLTGTLGTILTRRLLDAEKSGEDPLPLSSSAPVGLGDIAAYLDHTTDDKKIADLLWGLMLVNAESRGTVPPQADAPEVLPRAYALLKLTLLPGRLSWHDD